MCIGVSNVQAKWYLLHVSEFRGSRDLRSVLGGAGKQREASTPVSVVSDSAQQPNTLSGKNDTSEIK